MTPNIILEEACSFALYKGKGTESGKAIASTIMAVFNQMPNDADLNVLTKEHRRWVAKLLGTPRQVFHFNDDHITQILKPYAV